MYKKFISEHLGLDISGHNDIEYVDVNILKDTKLFVDPCLIYVYNDDFCVKARHTIDSFFDRLYLCYKTKAPRRIIEELLAHLGERNEAHLGYGNGWNGKGKTAAGMMDVLGDLSELIQNGVRIYNPIILPILLKNFAEDFMTDMEMNILYKEFSEFTLRQCQKFNIKTEPMNAERYYWDAGTGSWELYRGNCLRIDGKVLIMVPKHIVRKSYYYNTSQYFNSMIATRIQKDRTEYIDGRKVAPSKQDIREAEVKMHGSLLDTARYHTVKDPSYLIQYHGNMDKAYENRSMTDDELDAFVYKNEFMIA